MAKVFISYAKKDYIAADGSVVPGSCVDAILTAFQREGISYWLDREQLAGGDTYAARISRNIKECDVFLFLSSEAANSSEWTRREIGTGRARYRLKELARLGAAAAVVPGEGKLQLGVGGRIETGWRQDGT